MGNHVQASPELREIPQYINQQQKVYNYMGLQQKLLSKKIIFNELLHCNDPKFTSKLTCKSDKHF